MNNSVQSKTPRLVFIRSWSFLIPLIFALFLGTNGIAQSQPQPSQQPEIEVPENIKLLRVYEDSLQTLGDSVVGGSTYKIREAACVKLIPTLVRALKVEGAFDYPFDSLRTLLMLYPEDKKFRLITFQLLMWDATYRFFGAILRPGKEVTLDPLIDASLFVGNPTDTILDSDNWYGALYYNVIQRKYKGTQYYFLFGWDGHDMFSTKKLIDVMHFEKDKVVFGAPMFEDIEGNGTLQNRVIFEYKKNANMGLNYEKDLDMIIFDHLIPEDPRSTGVGMTYIPDGTYEGYTYHKGKWSYVEKVFDQEQYAAPLYPPKASEDRNPNIYKNRKVKEEN